MEDLYKIINEKSKIIWIDSSFAENRLDADYYSPNFIKIDDKIKKFSYKRIEELISGISGGSTPKGANYVENGIKFLRVQNIKENYYDLEDVVYITEEDNKSIKRSYLKNGDVLLTITGEKLGMSAVVNESILPANINQHSVKLTINKEIDKYYLSTFLNSRYGKMQTGRMITGGTRPALNYTDIKSIKVVLPSLKIQKDIGSKVRVAESLRKKVIKLREEAERYFYDLVNFSSYSFQSQKSFFVDNLRLEPYLGAEYYKPKYIQFEKYLDELKFDTLYLKDILIESPQKSNSPSKKDRVENGIPSIIVSDIDPYKLEIVENKINVLKDTYKKRKKAHIQENDVMFTTAGPPLGEATIVTSEFLPLLSGAHVTVFRCNNLCHPGYLTLFLNSKLGSLQTERHCYGIRQQYLFNDQLYKFRIPMLPKKIQNELGQQIIESIKKEYKSKLLIQEAKQDVEDLIEGKFTMEDN